MSPVTADSTRLRQLLAQVGWTQTQAAHELGIGVRTMRHYCAGDYEIPRVVWLALEGLLEKPPTPP